MAKSFDYVHHDSVTCASTYAYKTDVNFENCTGRVTVVTNKTNADRIRQMSDEEIEAWFWWMHDGMMWYTDSHDFLRKWLKKEVEE